MKNLAEEMREFARENKERLQVKNAELETRLKQQKVDTILDRIREQAGWGCFYCNVCKEGYFEVMPDIEAKGFKVEKIVKHHGVWPYHSQEISYKISW